MLGCLCFIWKSRIFITLLAILFLLMMLTCWKAPEFSNDLKKFLLCLKLEFLEIASLLAGGPTELYSLAMVTVLTLTEATELCFSGLLTMLDFLSLSFLSPDGYCDLVVGD